MIETVLRAKNGGPPLWIDVIDPSAFEHMPELTARFGYPLVWLAILGTVGGIYGWFRHRGWLR